MSKSKRVVNTILIIVVLIFTSKIVGLVRDSILAFRYGQSELTDTYTSALALTVNIFLSIGNALIVSMIPILIRLKKDKVAYERFLGSAFVVLISIGLLIASFGWIIAPEWVALAVHGFVKEPSKFATTVHFVRVLNFSAMFIFGTYFLIAFRQSNEKYILTSLVSYPFNLIFIVAMLFGFEYLGKDGLVYLTIIGWLLQLVMLTPHLRKMGLRFKIEKKIFNTDLMEMLIHLIPILLVTVSSKINIILDNRFASIVGEGGVASIYYANIIFIAISTTAIFAVSSVMFPKFNISLNEGSKEKFETTIINTLMSMVFALTILACFLFAMSENAVFIIFGRGAFDQQATQMTTDMLKWYAIGMLPLGILDVTNKSFYTIKKYKIPVISGAIIVMVNYVLMKFFTPNQPTYMIAVTTSISIFVGLIFSIYFLNKELHINIIRPLFKVTLQSLVAFSVTVCVVQWINHIQSTKMLSYFIQSIGIGIIGISVYFAILVVLKEPHVQFVINHYIFKKRGNTNEEN